MWGRWFHSPVEGLYGCSPLVVLGDTLRYYGSGEPLRVLPPLGGAGSANHVLKVFLRLGGERPGGEGRPIGGLGRRGDSWFRGCVRAGLQKKRSSAVPRRGAAFDPETFLSQPHHVLVVVVEF